MEPIRQKTVGTCSSAFIAIQLPRETFRSIMASRINGLSVTYSGGKLRCEHHGSSAWRGTDRLGSLPNQCEWLVARYQRQKSSSRFLLLCGRRCLRSSQLGRNDLGGYRCWRKSGHLANYYPYLMSAASIQTGCTPEITGYSQTSPIRAR